jgi:mono/diheme cytochrome c family protein
LKRFVLFALVLSLSACEIVDRDMYEQVSFKVQEAPRLTNPEGSVPMYGKKTSYEDVDGKLLASPFAEDPDAPLRGKKLYDIYCSPCHGVDGKSATPVSAKMESPPPDLTEASSAELTEGEVFVQIMTQGAFMPKYRSELTDKEGWEIAAYLGHLQGKR